MKQPLYSRLALVLNDQIRSGFYSPGEKLPSIRQASLQFSTSPTTVQQAYRQLEAEGVIESVPQSGYYVTKNHIRKTYQTQVFRDNTRPTDVTVNKSVTAIFEECQKRGVIDLGTGFPDHEYLPMNQLRRIFARQIRFNMPEILTAKFSAGELNLRQQIARRLGSISCHVSPDEVVVTSGCLEALSLCLSAVAQPGDTIAIETPTFPGLLQSIETLGLRALEIPSDSRTGISIDALELAIQEWDIKACALVPAFNNPSGSNMPAKNKEQLVGMLGRHKIPLIEDDLFGDLHYSKTRVPTAKSYDTQGLVLYCSSVSKSLGAGLRVGWICPGKYLEEVTNLEAYRNLNSPPLEQRVVAEFMSTGGYDRHLRKIRGMYKQQMERFIGEVHELFPPGTTTSQPQGGHLLWIELPDGLDGTALCNKALQEGVGIIPGNAFSPSQRYSSYFRLNTAVPWSESTREALQVLGKIAHRQLKRSMS